MRPGVPWSVKGIDDQARKAAKSAARDAGLTLGQWLNSIILETAESGSGHTGAAAKKAGQRKSTRGASADQPNETEIKKRLDQLADQLNDLTKKSQDTAVASFIQSTDGDGNEAGSVKSIIDRIEANERRSDAAIDEVNQRLQAMTDRLAAAPLGGMPERPEDVPGFSALETALRNIVDHIENSEKRTVDTISIIQERMADIAERATTAQEHGIDSNAPAIVSLEQRISDLAGRLEQGKEDAVQSAKGYVNSSIDQLSQRIDAVRHSTEAFAEQAQSIAARSSEDQSQQIEDKLKSVIQEMRASEQDSPQLSKLQGEVESLNQRFDDIKTESASERDVQALRTAIEQLTGQISTGPDLSPISDIEHRLGELAAKLEQSPAGDGVAPQVSDLEQRVQDLDARLQQAMSAPLEGGEPSGDLMTQITSVNERLTATEQKLGTLDTIERSISQLFESIEQNRVWAKEAAEEAVTRAVGDMPSDPGTAEGFAPSSELQALQEGLGAVKASAEQADQRNQETLEAVHDTLEQIIEKLTDLEQNGAAAPVQLQAEAAVNPFTRDSAPEMGPVTAGTPIVPSSDLPIMTPSAGPQPVVEPAAQVSPLDAPLPDGSDALQPAIDDPAAAEDFPATPAADPVFAPESAPEPAPEPQIDREDFIAAARRAAQSASSQSRVSVLGGLNMSPQRSTEAEVAPAEEEGKSKSKFSLSFLRRKKAANDQPKSIIPETTISATHDPDLGEEHKAVSGKRRQLILAGLILLAAVSAYSLGGLGKKGMAPKSGLPKTGQLEQSQSLVQLQNSLNQVQKKVSTADKTSLTVDLAQQDNELSKTSGMTSVVKMAEPVEPAPVDTASTQPTALGSSIATASLSPVLSGADKFDRDDGEAPLASNQGASISPPATPASNVTTAALTSAAIAAVNSQDAQLPTEIGSSSLRQAAIAGQANAQYVVGTRYLDGKQVKQDHKQAAEWYRRAAAQGLAPAQYRLGTLFERGRGMPKDMTAARLWYERAAERKNVKSMHNLAVIYANNEGGKAQFDKAAKWFQGAAEHGLRDSAYNLAVLNERGLGVPADQKRAYYWYGIAARLKDNDALIKLSSMKKQLPPAEVARLDKEVADWQPNKPDNVGNLVAITDPAWEVGTQQAATQPPLSPALDTEPVSEGDLILTAQKLLSGLGYDVGSMDGVMGSRTANAVRLFQLQTGQPVNGMVSPDLLQALKARQG